MKRFMLFLAITFIFLISQNISQSTALAQSQKKIDALNQQLSETTMEMLDTKLELREVQEEKQKLIAANDDNVKLLACIIQSEAGNQGYIGKVAVGAVVMNRVKDTRFPDTIKEVIYAPGQFDPVRFGTLSSKPSDECIKAAIAAMEGQDPTGGAIFFYNPDTATSKWIKTREVVAQIQNHNFAI